MENFKFTLFSIIVLVLMGVAGYWAFSTIESGSAHVSNQKQKELEQKNEELNKELTNLKKQISDIDLAKEQQIQKEQEAVFVETTVPTIPTPAKTTTTPTVLKNQSLINELQKLVDGNIYLKLKSQGPAVGTIQKFLNIYNKTSKKIDNDYGSTTVTAVKNFQKAEGLTADGEIGPGTTKKMIIWLKAH
jgi:murein L,D-transpeptidase YcbB/YkuD